MQKQGGIALKLMTCIDSLVSYAMNCGLAESLVNGVDISGDVQLQKHADWAEELKKQYTFTKENALDILMQETGRVFTQVLEDAGVYKCDEIGRTAFCAFVDAVNR